MIITFHGAVSGDYSDARNWSADDGSCAIPVDGDDVYISGSRSITSGLEQSGVELNSFTIVEYTGSIVEPLQIDADNVDITSGTQVLKVDLGINDFSCIVRDGSAVEIISDWLNLSSPSTQVLNVVKGSVTVSGTISKVINGAVADATNQAITLATETSFVQEFVTLSGTGTVNGRLDNFYCRGGTSILDTTDDVYQYLCYDGAIAYLDRFGTIENATLSGGVTNLLRTSLPRTIDSMNIVPSGNAAKPSTVKYDPSYVTITSLTVNGLVVCK